MLEQPNLMELGASLKVSFGCDTVDSEVHSQALLEPQELHNTFFRSVMDSWSVVGERERLKTLDWNTIELASCCDFWV